MSQEYEAPKKQYTIDSILSSSSIQQQQQWSSAVLVSIIVLDLSLLFDDVLFCLPFCWCPCMAINVSVQYDTVGFSPTLYC